MAMTTIDLKDLLRKILCKWRILIIVMAICCFGMTLFGTIRSVVEVQEIRVAYESQQAAGGPAEGEAPIVVPKVVWIDPSNMVIGLLLGAIAVIGVVTVKYALSEELRVKEDISKLYDVVVLGCIDKKKEMSMQNNRIDTWAANLFQKECTPEAEALNMDMLCTDIQLFSKKANISNLYLTSTCTDSDVQELMSSFENKLQDAVDKVSLDSSIIKTPSALEKLVGSDGVVLFEKIGASTYEDIKKEVACCIRYQIPIVGCIVIEK